MASTSPRCCLGGVRGVSDSFLMSSPGAVPGGGSVGAAGLAGPHRGVGLSSLRCVHAFLPGPRGRPSREVWLSPCVWGVASSWPQVCTPGGGARSPRPSPQGPVYLLVPLPPRCLLAASSPPGPRPPASSSPGPARPTGPLPRSQAAEPGPLASPLRGGDREPGKGSSPGDKGLDPAWAVGMVLCQEGHGTPGMALGASVYSVNYDLYITFSIPIVTN